MKRVLVTGGTRGIGKAIADQFKAEGCEVIITGIREESKDTDGFEYMSVDFGCESSTKCFFETLKSVEFDVLINNVGINNIKLISNVQDWEYDEIFSVNLKTPYFLCKAAALSMTKRGGGHIINIASIFSVVSKEKRSLYSTAKTGLVGLTKSLAIELGPDNILVNCVSPGFTNTDLTRKSLSKEEIRELESQIPLGRFANPIDIAEVVCFLCGNSYITGQNIVIDGGFTIK